MLEIIRHMEASGITGLPRFPIALDGSYKRFKTNSSGLDGWYIGSNIRDFTIVSYGDWSKDIKSTYKSYDDKELPIEVKIEFDELALKQKEEESRRAEECKQNAIKTWNSIPPIIPENISPYLVKKKLKFHPSLKQTVDILVVPFFNSEYQIESIQHIYPNGRKMFFKGVPSRELFYYIAGKDDYIYLTEGAANALTVFEATGVMTYASGSAQTLPTTAQHIRHKYPQKRLICVADNDGKDGAGQKWAYDTKRLVENTEVIIPILEGKEKCDISDIWVEKGKKEVSKMLTQIQHSSEKKLKPVQKFDIQMLPEAVQDFVQDVAQRLQVPLDFVAAPLIIAFGALIGARCGVKPMQHDDWIVHSNLWGAVVGNPGTRKTPAVEKAMAPLKELQKKSAETYGEEQKAYDNGKKIIEIEAKIIEREIERNLKDKLKKKNAQGVDEIENDIVFLNKKLNDLNEIILPTQKRYYSSDATTQKIGEILKNNPRGLLILVDELTFLFETFNAKGREGDRSFYLQGWSGTTGYTVDRIGRGTINIDKLFLSLCGTIQPGKLFHYVRESMTATSNDGLAQRLQLLVYPDPLEINDVDVPPNNEAKKRVHDIFEKIDSMDFTQYSAEQTGDSVFYQFSKDANEVRSNWCKKFQNKIRISNTDDPKQCALAEHLSKYESLMPSLALIFHIVDIADGALPEYHISVENIEKAIAWCEYLQSHAERIYYMNTNPDKDQDIQTARQLRNDMLEIFEQENLIFCKSKEVITKLIALPNKSWVDFFSDNIDINAKKLANLLKFLDVNPVQKKIDKKNARGYTLDALKKSNDIDEIPATGATGATAATTLNTKEKIVLSDEALPLPAATECDNNHSATEKVAGSSGSQLSDINEKNNGNQSGSAVAGVADNLGSAGENNLMEYDV